MTIHFVLLLSSSRSSSYYCIVLIRTCVDSSSQLYLIIKCNEPNRKSFFVPVINENIMQLQSQSDSVCNLSLGQYSSFGTVSYYLPLPFFIHFPLHTPQHISSTLIFNFQYGITSNGFTKTQINEVSVFPSFKEKKKGIK